MSSLKYLEISQDIFLELEDYNWWCNCSTRLRWCSSGLECSRTLSILSLLAFIVSINYFWRLTFGTPFLFSQKFSECRPQFPNLLGFLQKLSYSVSSEMFRSFSRCFKSTSFYNVRRTFSIELLNFLEFRGHFQFSVLS